MYKSMGGEITVNRIQTFNKLYGNGKPFEFTIIDLKDNKRKACGTRVIIQLAKATIENKNVQF